MMFRGDVQPIIEIINSNRVLFQRIFLFIKTIFLCFSNTTRQSGFSFLPVVTNKGKRFAAYINNACNYPLYALLAVPITSASLLYFSK